MWLPNVDDHKKIQEFVAIPVLLIKFGVKPYPKNKEG
jgi:hypothetical protein